MLKRPRFEALRTQISAPANAGGLASGVEVIDIKL